MCNLCRPQPYTPCDICCARRDIKTQAHFDNGRLNREQYDCMMAYHDVNEHEQQHSEMLDVCVDKGMLGLVEHVNVIGVPTSFSCLNQDGRGTVGIVIKTFTAAEISEIIRVNHPEFDDMIYYHEWLNLGINRSENKIPSVTLYFPKGVPPEFAS